MKDADGMALYSLLILFVAKSEKISKFLEGSALSELSSSGRDGARLSKTEVFL